MLRKSLQYLKRLAQLEACSSRREVRVQSQGIYFMYFHGHPYCKLLSVTSACFIIYKHDTKSSVQLSLNEISRLAFKWLIIL
jgi:hypothetical protein